MANATSTQLQELYVAYFGRAADPTGLDYWTEKGITTSKFAADMYAQAEFKDAYGSLSTESQVNQIYNNLFDRDADATGLLYWTKEIDLGNLQLAEIATHLIWAAQNNAGSEDDKTALTNKTNAAVAYTAKVKETTAAILAYQAESTDPWTSGSNIKEAVSYMADINKDTESTAAGIAASVTTITNNGVPSLAKNYSLTSGVDDIDGTAGTNKFQAGLTSSGGNTLNSLDELDGGLGSDTLNASIATSITPGSITNIENINLTFEASKTFNASNVSGVTTYTDLGSTAAGTISNIGDLTAALSVSDNAVGSTFTYQANAVTGDSDSLSLTLSNATGGNAKITTITGAIETLNLTSATSANSVRLDAAATTLNISGSADLTLGASSTALDNTTTIDASAATGAITFAHDHASDAVTITGGSGNDSITLTGAGAQTEDTVSGGAGDDTFTFTHNSDLTDGDVINGGAGTDTLVGDDGELVALTTANNISNIEVIESDSALASGTLTLANIDSSISSVTLAAGANAGTVVFGAGSNTLTMGASNGGALTVTDTGLATNDTLTINAGTVDGFNNNSVAINGFEAVNFSTGTTSTNDEQDVSTFNVTGDPDSAGTRTSATLTITGKAAFHASGIITLGTDGSGTGTIDASALEGNFVMGGIGAGMTTITGGAGNDTILGDSHASTLTGGAGNDAITGGAAADTISGGAGNDTLTLTAGGTDINDTITGGAGNDIFYTSQTNLAAAHVLTGGDGTDSIKLSNITAVTDAQFENNTGIEVLTSDASGLAATLDVYAQAMGITTVTFAGTASGAIADTVTIQDDVTNAITVNIDALNDDGSGSDDSVTVDATSYTGVLTITTAAATAITGAAGNAATAEVSLTGGTGTSDTLNFHGGTYTNTHLTGITAIENWTQSDDVTSSITIDELNIADGKTLTIDVTSIIDASNTSTINLVDDSNGISTVHGGTGVDTITGSSSDLGDTINGNSGADVIKFVAAQLTTLDTVDGGGGTDTINIITTAAALADADFTNISNVEKLTFSVASSNTDLGAEYVGTGSTVITLAAGTNDLNLDSVTSDQTLNLIEGTDTIDASSMTGALTVVIAEGEDLDSSDTITAGTGTSDVLKFTHDTTAVDLAKVTGFETIESGADTSGFTVTTADANVASTKSLTINTTAQATNGYTVNIAAETNGAITITGGAAAGTIVLSSSSMGDTFTGGAGNDGLTVIGAQLTSLDTLNGGAGTDTLTIGTVGTLSDADFTNISNFEALVGGDGDITMVLGSEYAAAGFTSHTEYDNNDTAAVSVTYGSGVNTAQTYTLKTSSTTLSATGMTGALTVAGVEGDLTSADTVTGGSGSDTLTLTFDGTNAASASDLGSVTSIENFKSATNAVGGFIFADANAVSTNFTVDASANTSAAFTVNASAEDDSAMTYTGGGGIDTVTGTDFTTTGDTITSGAGADVITGGKGGDTITGGAGADVFTYTAANQSTGSERDSITDFTSGTDKFAVTIDKSSSSAALTFDASVQTARAGTSLIQENMSGSIGQTFYDTTNDRVVINMNSDTSVSTLDLQIDVNAAATETSTIAAVDFSYSITGGSGADTIVVDGGTDTVVGGGGVDKITITDTTASQDTVTLTAGAASVDYITGFTVGGSGDHLLAADATHAWLGVGASSNNNGVVAVGTAADLGLAEANDDDATILTTSTAMTAGILATFESGSTSEAQLEAAAISALGNTTTKITANDILMVLCDDGTSTAVFKFTSEDGIADAVTVGELEIMAVLKGVAAAETVVAGDIVFA